MKRPVKKNYSEGECGAEGMLFDAEIKGYNAACEDWEKFFPSEEEIMELLHETNIICTCGALAVCGYEHFSKAIHERLKGE